MPIKFKAPEAEAPLPTAIEEATNGLASTVETAVDPNPPVSNSSEPIQFDEPPVLQALPETIEVEAAIADLPKPTPRKESTWQEKKDSIDNAAEREKMEFYEKIMAARTPPPEAPKPPPPVAPRITEQTAAEMAAGAEQVARHAHQRLVNPPPPREDDTRTTRVFAPEDYVPDPRKGQGIIPTTTYRQL